MQSSIFASIMLAVIMVAVGLFDVWASLFRGPEWTISAVVLDVSRRHPMLPFAAGILAGHLFWAQ